MPKIQLADRQLYYELRGDDGPVLVLLNGMSQSTANWATQARHLSEQYRVLMYDARGQGRSDLGAPTEVTLDGHVSDLRALLDALAYESVVLCGFSHGARVALAFAAAEPDRVERLALTSIGDGDDALRRTIVRSWSEVLRLGGLEAMAWTAIPDILGRAFMAQNETFLDAMVKATLQRNSAEGLGALLVAMRGFAPALDDARGVACPVLLVTSSEDLLVSPESANRLAAALPGCVHERVDGCGHTVPIELAGRWRSLVGEFLGS